MGQEQRETGRVRGFEKQTLFILTKHKSAIYPRPASVFHTRICQVAKLNYSQDLKKKQ